MDKEISLAIMGGVLAIAGLLLVFSGFLFARSDQLEPKRGKKYRLIARLGLVPFVASIACTWISLQASKGNVWSVNSLECVFDAVLFLTSVYAVVSLLIAK
jgi:hypothetical protein